MCSAIFPIPQGMLASDSNLCIWGINYSFGPANGKNCFGAFFIEDFGADRSKSYFAPGLELVIGGWDYFILSVDAYYFINPGNSSPVLYPIKLGVGFVNAGIDIQNDSNKDEPWLAFAGYTFSAGVLDFAAQTSKDGKSYFCPYLDAALDGTFTGRLNPRLEVSPAFTFLDKPDTGSGGGTTYYYYY
jgi:hypothetical protein